MEQTSRSRCTSESWLLDSGAGVHIGPGGVLSGTSSSSLGTATVQTEAGPVLISNPREQRSLFRSAHQRRSITIRWRRLVIGLENKRALADLGAAIGLLREVVRERTEEEVLREVIRQQDEEENAEQQAQEPEPTPEPSAPPPSPEHYVNYGEEEDNDEIPETIACRNIFIRLIRYGYENGWGRHILRILVWLIKQSVKPKNAAIGALIYQNATAERANQIISLLSYSND